MNNKKADFLLTVIVPVFNAAQFVEQAVVSALAQPETAEVLLIEDGSPDNSLEVCQLLEKKYDKVSLMRHSNGENRGAGASRNLGIITAKYDFIAFLDADDYYLRNRFVSAGKIFAEQPSCEGVYEAIGSYVENEEGLKRWQEAGKPEDELYTVKSNISSENLADALISGKCGSFHLDGVVVKKSVFDQSGLLNEKLALHQDTEFIIRVAMVAQLAPGRLDEPVAVRRLHEENRISAPRSPRERLDDRLLMWSQLYDWCKSKSYDHYQQMIMPIIIKNVISKKRFKRKTGHSLSRKLIRLKLVGAWLARNPKYLLDAYFWQSMKEVVPW